MNPLRPTLWRTCRAIANTTRLRLLWKIFEMEGLCVGELARATRTSRENATIQLRALSSRGLITPQRRDKRVIYRAVANPGVEGAEELLAALRKSFDLDLPLKAVFRDATAFTHSRRIALMKTVCAAGGCFEELSERSGMSGTALQWNLSKLEARGFVRQRKGRYEAVRPKSPLGKCLMHRISMPERGSVHIAKIISGGQTGADRAALDAAIACGVPHGGWCPQGRLAEDGRIPETYPLQELQTPSYSARTRANVAAADLTLIFSHGPLTGGSLLTQQAAEELAKPCLHMDMAVQPDVFQAVENRMGLLPDSGAVVLNVAGPRASNDPKIYDAVFAEMVGLLRRF